MWRCPICRAASRPALTRSPGRRGPCKAASHIRWPCPSSRRCLLRQTEFRRADRRRWGVRVERQPKRGWRGRVRGCGRATAASRVRVARSAAIQSVNVSKRDDSTGAAVPPAGDAAKLRMPARRSCSGAGFDEVAAGVFHGLRCKVIVLIVCREAYAEEPRLVRRWQRCKSREGWALRRARSRPKGR